MRYGVCGMWFLKTFAAYREPPTNHLNLNLNLNLSGRLKSIIYRKHWPHPWLCKIT